MSLRLCTAVHQVVGAGEAVREEVDEEVDQELAEELAEDSKQVVEEETRLELPEADPLQSTLLKMGTRIL